jgi:hypothetical protein
MMPSLGWLLWVLFVIGVRSLPNRGHYPFTIALCNYPDNKKADLEIDGVKKFFTSSGANTPGMFKYIQEQSHGNVDLEGTEVNGWFTTDESYTTMLTYTRQQRLDQCRNAAAKAGFVVPPV